MSIQPSTLDDTHMEDANPNPGLPPEILVGVRYFIAVVGPYVSTYFPAGSWEQIAALVPSVIAVIYAIVINRRAQLAHRAVTSAPMETLEAVAKQAGVTHVALRSQKAANRFGPKVIGPTITPI